MLATGSVAKERELSAAPALDTVGWYF